MAFGPAETWCDFDPMHFNDEPGTAAGGVFGLFKDKKCVYVAGANNIRAELERLAKGSNPCVSRYKPNQYQYQLVLPSNRQARVDELRSSYKPLCP